MSAGDEKPIEPNPDLKIVLKDQNETIDDPDSDEEQCK